MATGNLLSLLLLGILLSFLTKVEVVDSFSTNVRNLSQFSSIVRNNEVTAFFKEGMWGVFMDENYERVSAEGVNVQIKGRRYKTMRSGFMHGGTKQVTMNRDGVLLDVKLRIPKSIRHIGNEDMNSAGLSFYTKSNFGGEELYFFGTRLILPSVVNFHSYGYTLGTSGKHFQLFQNQRFQPEYQVGCLWKLNAWDYRGGFEESRSILLGSIALSNCSEAYQKFASWRMKKEPEMVGANSEAPFVGRNKEVLKGIFAYYNTSQALTPSIALWTVEEALLFFEGSELRLPFTHDAVVYRLYGDRNYTVYTGPDFDGEWKCIVASEHREPFERYGPYGPLVPGPTFKVKSIRRGCEDDPTPVCGLANFEYEVIGYTPKPRQNGDNADTILRCNPPPNGA